MEDIYFNCTLLKRVVVPSKHLNANIDSYIHDYIRKNVEGICIHEGYIKPETISVLKKSVGILLGSSFTGDITYDVAYTAQVCNPVIGNVINCKVKFVNKMGVLASNGPITVIIGRQFHLNNELEKIGRDDNIKVEVVARTFSLNDKEIKVVAKLYGSEVLNSANKSLNSNDFTESDLTPIIENDFDDNLFENTEDITNDILEESDEEDAYSIDENEEEDEDPDEYLEDDEKESVKLDNPDEDNIKLGDIEISDDEDYSEDEEEVGNDEEY
jgi:DNA-directed RNA polymerase II subunit RPB7